MIFNRFYTGEQNSEETLNGSKSGYGFYDLQNIDVHSKLGSATCNNTLVPIVGANVPTEATIGVLDNSGNLYLLSKASGKIWMMAVTTEAYTLPHTNANTVHCGGGHFNNRLWFATATKLGYFDGSSWVDSHGTFGVGNAIKAFLKTGVNRAFAYFTDGAQLARVDKDNTFGANVLEISLDEVLTDLAEWGNDIVWASYIGTKKPISRIGRWNQFGDTYERPDLIPDKFVSCLFESTRSNVLFALVGDSGLIMHYTGDALSQLKELKNETVVINPYNKTIHQGRAYFATGNTIYSLHTSDSTLPYALVKEYQLASGVTIDSLESNGDVLYVTAHSATEYFVYKTSTNYATAILTTPIIQGTPKAINIPYRSMPANCSITGRIKVDGGSWVAITLQDNAEQMRYSLSGGIPSENLNFCQIEISLIPSGATKPIISAIEII